eukprot:TRINITY_DN29292_c0_g1_i1.p1 TRINITY_DN29292_c0_g1~~TRINITY_DN29292_c0_g1_i1.p1  ORF type:complete len:776 (-),score=228.29 TRINITY_DN29292_c0_g1_i1:78-2297(-)
MTNVDDGLRCIEEERVQPLLNYLKSGVFENKTNFSFMKAYSVVVQFGDQNQQCKKLYDYYKRVITNYCQENMPALENATGQELLKKLAELWEKSRILIFWMQRVFQYLDRFFTKSKGHDDLFKGAMVAFQETVYDRVKDKLIWHGLIDVINRERNGEDIDKDVVGQLIEMLCTVGDSQPKIEKVKGEAAIERLYWKSSSGGVYKADFERPFLAATSEYYKLRVAGWMAECSCPQFLDILARRLNDEERRLNQYLDRSSQQELQTVVQRELILNTAKHLVEMETGCKAMFQNKKYDELQKMYKLFRREPSMLVHMTEAMEPYISQRCAAVVSDQALIDNPPEYAAQVLALKKEVDDMVATCFENDSNFQKARNKGLEHVLNKDTRCAKYLAVYSDAQLKKGLKGMSEYEMMALVTQVVGLFTHIKDKDIFLESYKNALSRRLLNKQSVSNDAEDAFITKLKVEVGQQATQKLVAMFTDMSLSDSLQEEYNKESHKGAPGGVQHEVRVLQTNAWPEKPDDLNVDLCAEMKTCIRAFEAFYNSKHTGRKLRWVYTRGNVELGTACFTRKHILAVSVFQCLALMLFNKKKQVSFKEICEATHIPPEECKRQILSLTVPRHKVLLKDTSSNDFTDGTMFEINKDFTHEKVKVLVNLIKKEEKMQAEANAPEAPGERKHLIDAAIVRIMKSRKKLEHNLLLEEVCRLCTLFKPQPQQIKFQIEHLIDREFLQRDAEQRNVYIYLA